MTSAIATLEQDSEQSGDVAVTGHCVPPHMSIMLTEEQRRKAEEIGKTAQLGKMVVESGDLDFQIGSIHLLLEGLQMERQACREVFHKTEVIAEKLSAIGMSVRLAQATCQAVDQMNEAAKLRRDRVAPNGGMASFPAGQVVVPIQVNVQNDRNNRESAQSA